jgi:hypothetical protein
MRRFLTMALVVFALAIPAGSAAASPVVGSEGCSALNSGAWNVTQVAPPAFVITFSELNFLAGEVINISINVTSTTSGGGSFHLDAFDPFERFFSVSSGGGPFPATNFSGQYTITGSGDLSLGASMGANNQNAGAVTNISTITCTASPDSDGDGVNDDVDNCVNTPNAGQENFDGDAFGDACDSDVDGDQVANGDDLCGQTELAEAEPAEWKKNRYAADASGSFVDANGRESGITVVDTFGCSGVQIVEASGLGQGHSRFGITKSALLDWIAGHNGA